MSLNKQQIIQKLKLNHGLFLNGCNIQSSKQAVIIEDGELNISLYDEEPLVYTYINDLDSPTNLLTFKKGIRNNTKKMDDSDNNVLEPLIACINIPIAKITYKG